jgi:sec-independent protein translocase protein TatB
VFSLGGPELVIILVFALILFGPDKIPQLARTLGRVMREFNKYKDIMEGTIRQEIWQAERDAAVPPTPLPDPNEKITQAAAVGTALRDEIDASAGVELQEIAPAEVVAAAPTPPPATPAPIGDDEEEEEE